MPRVQCSLYLGCLAAAGCVLVSPLDGARLDDPQQTDAGPARRACRRLAMNRCDPEACGCTQAQVCTWDEATLRGICAIPPEPVEPQAPHAGAGERCLRSDDCEAGMTCSSFDVCAMRCSEDSDCSEGDCVLHGDGQRLCRTACDPVAATGCADQTACIPVSSDDLERLKHANCAGITPELATAAPRAEGEPCRELTDCMNGLSCVPEVGEAQACSRWCRKPTDCPESRPVCWNQGGLFASVGDPVSACFSCEATVDTPGWVGGPVWSSAQREQCRAICDDGDLDCIAASCDDGERYVECMVSELLYCAGGPRAACPAELRAVGCCHGQLCWQAGSTEACLSERCLPEAEALLRCTLEDSECQRLAESTCVIP